MVGILLNENGDLFVENNKLKTGDNTPLIAENVLKANRGEYKEAPLIGAEIIRLQNGTHSMLWCSNAKRMLQAVKIPVTRLYIQNNTICLE